LAWVNSEYHILREIKKMMGEDRELSEDLTLIKKSITLVTNNTHFDIIENLKIEKW
jgi:hypothetical protein